jgi:hypothetical protein
VRKYILASSQRSGRHSSKHFGIVLHFRIFMYSMGGGTYVGTVGRDGTVGSIGRDASHARG